MSRPMTLTEFASVINHVRKYNSPICGQSPRIKYIDPVFDMRSDTVFAITFRGFGPEKVFHCQNECRDLPESLYDRCMAFLNNGVDPWH